MTPRSELDRIPTEIMEDIANRLSLNDICSLRLTAREIMLKVSQGVFRTYFYHKKIEMTPYRLQLLEFVHMTQPERMGCHLQHLILVSPLLQAPSIYDHNRVQKQTGVLGNAMKNLSLNVARGSLLSVTLMVDDGCENDEERRSKWKDWPLTWAAAAELFHITTLALGASLLPIECFDIFGTVERCSLACSHLAPVLSMSGLSTSLAGLKRLSLSLSHERSRGTKRSDRERPLAGSEKNVKSICDFLNLCPVLEDLQLHWFKLSHFKLMDADLVEQYFFEQVAASCRFPFLKSLTLQGIMYTSSAALLLFLQQAPLLASLTMESIDMRVKGGFRPIFDHLVDHKEHLDYLHLDNLLEKSMVCFNAPGAPHFSTANGNKWPNDLTRKGADARKPIEYRAPGGRQLGSPHFVSWFQRRIRLYGPADHPG